LRVYVRTLTLTGDYTNVVTSILTGKINQLKNEGLLSPKMAKYCLPPAHPRPAQLYFLKKIHKTPMGIRPIVSSINSANRRQQ